MKMKAWKCPLMPQHKVLNQELSKSMIICKSLFSSNVL